MKLVDANLLLYATNKDAPRHADARAWMEEVLSGAESVAFAWMVLIAFLRLSTKPKVFTRPLTVRQAFACIDAWLSQPCAIVVHPTHRHLEVLEGVCRPLGVGGNIASDAHLAALAIEHGAEMCSCDADFGRFQGITWTNPLA